MAGAVKPLANNIISQFYILFRFSFWYSLLNQSFPNIVFHLFVHRNLLNFIGMKIRTIVFSDIARLPVRCLFGLVVWWRIFKLATGSPYMLQMETGNK